LGSDDSSFGCVGYAAGEGSVRGLAAKHSGECKKTGDGLKE